MKIAQNRKKVQSVRKNKEEFHDSYSIIGYIECSGKTTNWKMRNVKEKRGIFIMKQKAMDMKLV